MNEVRPDVMSFDILGNKISFGQRKFDLIIGLRHSTRHVRSNICSAKLRRIYLNDSTTMKGFELDRLFPSLQFENDQDVVKMTIFYFIKLAMMGRERKQQMDMSLLSVIDEWDRFRNKNWSKMIFDKTIKGLNKALTGKAKLYM